MSREHLSEVLDTFARVTSIIVETSRIKEYLDNCSTDEGLQQVYERIKVEVENLNEEAVIIKELFSKQNKITVLNGNSADNEQISNGDSALGDEHSKDATNRGKPLIKLVDIKKLVEPKSLIKPVYVPPMPVEHRPDLSDTIVLITSSDEEVSKQSKASKKAAKVKKVAKLQNKESRARPATIRRKAAERTIAKTKLVLQDDSSSDDSIPRGKKFYKKKTTNLDNVTLSDTSSGSDSTTTKSSENPRNKKGKRRNSVASESDTSHTQLDWKKDNKIKSDCVVKVVRIPCEKLKEHYLEKLDLLKIKNLGNFDALKRKKAQKIDSDNSTSGSEEHAKKKTKTSKSSTSPKDDKSSSSSDEQANKTSDDILLPIEPAKEPASAKPSDAEVDLALNLLESDKETDNETETGGVKSGDEPDKGDATKEVTSKDDEGKEKETEEETQAVINSESNEEPISQKTDEENPEKNKSDGEQEATSENKKKSAIAEEGDKSDKESEKNKSESETEGNKSDAESKGNKSDAESKGNKSGKESEGKSDKESDGDKSDAEEKKKKQDEDASKKSWKKDKLLTEKLSSTDSEEEFNKFRKKKEKQKEDASDDDEKEEAPKEKKKRLKLKHKKKIISDSESDFEKPSASEKSSSDSEKESKDKSEDEEEEKKKKSLKRVKRLRDSSEEDDDEKSTRKQIRHIWGRDSLAETTKQAEAQEKERKARIAEKQKKYNQVYENNTELNAKVDKVVLDFDEKNKEELLKVDDALVSKLKPHQASGIQFMWDACFESLERAEKTTGSGCILAHCMGLGKTLQVIALSHTLLINYEQTKVKKVMVVSPLNTVLNWVSEYKQWLPDLDDFEVYELVSFKQNYERQYQLKSWHNHGGVLIIGYDMFRNLSNPENKRLNKKMRAAFQEALVDPGPDLVICDEGHLLKNEKTNTSIAMNRLRTLRRIVLTGTPLQNNLKEYFCMVQFIKPNLLGTYKEYLNRFVNPIINGQYTDSTLHDIQVMRRRSHVLHKLLDGIVQRRDYSVLAPYLPPKHEYVLFLTLTETQIKMYQHYMDHFAKRSLDGSNRTSFLFVDFQALQRICTHPRVLLDKSIENKLAKEKRDEDESDDDSEGSLKDFINDDDEDSSSNSNSSSDDDMGAKVAQKKRLTRAAHAAAKEKGEEEDLAVEIVTEPRGKEWWQDYCDGDELNVIDYGSKLSLLFEILKECEQIGDKVLVFSQSLYSLNIIEYFLGRIHDATEDSKPETVSGFTGSWCLGLDYFRLDGSSSCDNRSAWCKTFNNPKNTRARLFLISTRAGGLGINLVAANRVIIFDVSWNPSHDVQSIYRVYRFGQTKPCYIYRFVTQGTMEMKIYERQVTKQAISKRVVDEQQIDRHYNQNDLQELYRFEPKPEDRPIPLVPKDVLLGELLMKYSDKIYKYHEHQSLLENKEDEGLNEDERKAAWEEFENEKQLRINSANTNNSVMNVNIALANILRKENPAWTEAQIKSLIPTLHAQLQDQVAQGDLTLYRRVQQEMQILQAIRNQQIKENFYREQAMKLMLQQQQMAAAMKSFNGQNADSWVNHYLNQVPGPSRGQAPPATNSNPNEVIDLND